MKYYVKFEQNGDAILYQNETIVAKRKWDNHYGSYFWKSDIREVQEVIDVWGKWSTSGGLIEALKRELPYGIVERDEKPPASKEEQC
jgi:hypothetical protein